MDENNEIIVQLDGDGRQPPCLSDFASVLDSLRESLANVSRCLVGKETDFAVRELRTGSAIVEVAPVPNGVPPRSADDVSATFKRTVHALEVGGMPDERLDYAALAAFKKFNRVVKRTNASLSIDGLRLTPRFTAHLADLLQTSPASFGSVRGRLEKVSVHAGHCFWLYPPVANEKVKCAFQPILLPAVLGAIDRSVTVYGKLKYAKAKAFPIEVEVDSFELDPLDESLPDLLEARGFLSERQLEDRSGEWRDEW